LSIWEWLLNPAGLTAHGFCLSWAPGLVALHAGSDAVIGLAYFSIPVAMAWFVRERRDFQHWPIAYLFAAFILGCGTIPSFFDPQALDARLRHRGPRQGPHSRPLDHDGRSSMAACSAAGAAIARPIPNSIRLLIS